MEKKKEKCDEQLGEVEVATFFGGKKRDTDLKKKKKKSVSSL